MLMKMYLIYLLLFLSYFGISCQEQYSDAIITEYLELDESLKHSNVLIEETALRLILELEESAKIIIQLDFLVKKAREVHSASTDLKKFIWRLRDTLLLETGGYEEEALSMDKLIPKGARNIALVEEVLFSKHPSQSDSSSRTISKVEILEQKMKVLYTAYLQIIGSCWDDGGLKGTIFADIDKKQATFNQLKKELSLYAFDGYQTKEHMHPTWADFNFKNKPLAAVCPILRKIENDVLVSEYMLISFLSSQFSGCNFRYEAFHVFAQSSKPSIRLGETYEAEIGLGTYDAKVTYEVLVNDNALNQVKGKAIYRVRPKKVGEQHYDAKIHYTNPLTGDVTTFIRSFYFDVIP